MDATEPLAASSDPSAAPSRSAAPDPKHERRRERRATWSSIFGGLLFIGMLGGFGYTLREIYREFAPVQLHLVDVRFQGADAPPQPANPVVPSDPVRAAEQEARIRLERQKIDPGEADKLIAMLDAQALQLHYFATFAHREILGFWFNLFAGTLLILFGMFVFLEATINGEPDGENAFEFHAGEKVGLTLKSRSLGMVAVTSGAAVLLLVKQANQPTTEIVKTYFEDVQSRRDPTHTKVNPKSQGLTPQEVPPPIGGSWATQDIQSNTEASIHAGSAVDAANPPVQVEEVK